MRYLFFYYSRVFFCRNLRDLHRGSYYILCRVLLALGLSPVLLVPFEQVVWASETVATLPVSSASSLHSSAAPLPSSSKHSLATATQVLAGSGSVSLASTWQAWRLPHRLFMSPLTHLPVLADGQTALPSNAHNFHGAWNASVDPRTGTASFTLTVASTLYDQGQAKRDLVLSYNGGPSARGPDTFGLGPHWSFNVGTEHPSASEVAGHQTTDITTGDGHGFTMVSVRNAQGQIVWRPLRHKLGDVTITGQPGNWTIAMATGIQEHLRNGYEDWEQGRDGQRVWFYYDHQSTGDTTRHLKYVCAHTLTPAQVQGNTNACQDNGVWMTYQGNTVTIHGQQQIVLHQGEDGGITNINAITLPSLSSANTGVSNSEQPAAIDFSYDGQGNLPWLLHTVTYPTGGTVTFLYDAESDRANGQPNGLPTGLNGAYLPVVTEQIVNQPQALQAQLPQERIWYRYGTGGAREHNYTGYQSGGSMEPGRDNLLDRPDSYTYSVTQDNGTTSTTTTYNKYHLPLSTVQVSDSQKNTIARSDQQYLPWKQTTFNQLPSNYSFPLKIRKTLYAIDEQGQDSAIQPARVIQAKKYNSNGQVIWKEDAYGRQTFTKYCPPQGNSHCPAMDLNWPQVTRPEKILRVPARHSPAGSQPFMAMDATNDQAPATEIIFNYIKMPVAQKYLLLQRLTKNTHTTETPGFWEVSTKTVGTLPLSSVANLKPGDALPILASNQINTQTHYRYNTEQSSPVYGQLTQFTVTNFPASPPVVQGALLKVAADPIPATPRQKVTINVTHSVDPASHTHTTVMAVKSSASTPQDIKNLSSLLVQSGAGKQSGLSLGTSVYSLVSGVKLSSEDTLKTQHSTWTYDVWNRPIKKVVTPTHGGKPQITRWAYIMTPQEMAIVKTLPNGNQEKIDLSADNKVIATWHRFANLTSASMVGSSNWIEDTATTYTKTGKVASHTAYHAADPQEGGQPGKTIALTTFYGYDTLNRQTWVRQPDGVVNVTVRNDPAMQVIRYEVATAATTHKEQLGPMLSVIKDNVLGKPTARYLLPLEPETTKDGKPLYSPALQAQLTALRAQLQPVASLQSLDSYGLLPVGGSTGVLAFVNAAIAAGAWYTRVTTRYDGNGRRIRQTLGNGATTQWQWQQGSLVATTLPDGRMIHDTFNVQGQKVARCVQPAGSSVCHTLGTRGYDNEGNLAWQADEQGNTIHYTYDGDGRRLSMILPAAKTGGKGHVFTYQYNSLGPTGAALDGTPYVKYTYNPTTWKLTDRDDAISHLHYQYDPHSGQLTRITRSAPIHFKSPVGIHYPTGTTTIRYDRYNQPTAYTDSEGDTYTAVHDSLGRIIQLQVQLPGQTQPTLLTATTYDAFGRPHSITNGAGITRTFTYNNLGQLKKTVDSHNGQPFQQLSYTYDPDTNNILTFTRVEGNNSATQTYRYDLSDNLIAMTCSATGKPGTASTLCPRDTDLSGSSLTAPPIITAQHYAFDTWNNIKSVTETLITSRGKTTTKTVNYSYAGDKSITGVYDPNQMIGFTTTWANQRYSAIPKTLAYDRLGRVIKDAAGDRLHYNAFGQQDGFTNAKTGQYTRYTYDSNGHQVAEQPFASIKQQHPLQSPLYMLYSGNSITAQAQEDAQHHLHVSVELGGIAHSEDGVITRWYLHDYKGDVLNTFNTQGTLLSDNVYSPYGMHYNRLSTAVQTLPAMLQLKNQAPWWQSHLPGFDNQMQDPATGYQFLGGGYRAYNPVYRHFMAKDSFSPFKKIDGYGFVANNPIMNVDPTGHSAVEFLSLGIAFMFIAACLLIAFPFAAASGIVATLSDTVGIVAASAIGVPAFIKGYSLLKKEKANPNKETLAVTNDVFGMQNSPVGSPGPGAMGSLPGTMNAIKHISSVAALTTLASSTSRLISGDAGILKSMKADMIRHPARKKALSQSLQPFEYLSIMSMAVSVFSGIGAGTSVAKRVASNLIVKRTQTRMNAGTPEVIATLRPENDIASSSNLEGRNFSLAYGASAEPSNSIMATDQTSNKTASAFGEERSKTSFSKQNRKIISDFYLDANNTLELVHDKDSDNPYKAFSEKFPGTNKKKASQDLLDKNSASNNHSNMDFMKEDGFQNLL